MTVSDNPILGEGLQGFFKNLGKKGLNLSKNMAKNVLKNPSRASDITANIASAAASTNPTNALSTLLEAFNFYHKKNVYTLKNLFESLPSKWSKKPKPYTHPQH